MNPRPLLALGLALGVSAHAAPKIVAEKAEHDFGQVPNTTRINHTFVLRNDGDQELRVDRIQPSCGCTVAEISTKTLAPGATAQIPTVLDLNGKRGPMTKTVTVYSNDPATPQLRLSLTGAAIVDVEVTPGFLFLPSMPFGMGSTGLVNVVATGTNEVAVTGITSTSPAVSATFVNKPGRKGAEIQVSARVAEGGPLVTSGRLNIATDNPRYAEVYADYSFNIIDKLTVVPSSMAFSVMVGPNARPVPPVNRILRVRAGTVKQFKVLDAIWPEDGKKGKIVDLGPSGFQITFQDIVAKQELNGKAVILKTDVPGREEIRIPVSIASYGGGPGVSYPAPAVPVPAPVPAPATAPAPSAPAPQ